MKTLALFNAVIAKKSNKSPHVSDQGYIIEPAALWAKTKIIDYYNQTSLDGNDLNKTFHKSWAKIKNSSRFDLFLDQIQHYMSTYGSNFQDEVYIPAEVLELPDVKLKYKVIRAYSTDEMTKKCLSLLQSGMALKEETINDVITILVDELGYEFTGNENIRNKEATIKIADLYGVLPTDVMEFFRYIIYRTTGESLLIKNHKTIADIKSSNFNPSVQFDKFGLDRLSSIFNRYKPLFLAFKGRCPKTINKLAKLSKKNHEPMVINPLNVVTSELLTDDQLHWLDNATPYALFKAISACYSRMRGQNAFVYRIRNGKSYTKENNSAIKINKSNYAFLISYIKDRFDLSGKKIFIPKDVKYALPTSEKMYVGNIPTGTRFFGTKLAVGMYWENAWGARDFDLSGLNIAGKIGWNATYNQGSGTLYYSGDITNAPNGAVEYLYANKGLKYPTLVMNSVYSGDINAGLKIIVGKGDGVNKNYMMNPENLFMEVKTESVQRETVLGMLIPKKDKQCFVLLNFGSGNARVAGNNALTDISTRALYQQWSKPFSFNKLVKLLGAEVIESDKKNVDFDMSLDALELDSFVNVFNEASKRVEVEVVPN